MQDPVGRSCHFFSTGLDFLQVVKETIGRGPDCGIVVLMCFLETTKDAVQRCGFLVGRLSVNEVLLQLRATIRLIGEGGERIAWELRDVPNA